jgi:hypothetical protein
MRGNIRSMGFFDKTTLFLAAVFLSLASIGEVRAWLCTCQVFPWFFCHDKVMSSLCAGVHVRCAIQHQLKDCRLCSLSIKQRSAERPSVLGQGWRCALMLITGFRVYIFLPSLMACVALLAAIGGCDACKQGHVSRSLPATTDGGSQAKEDPTLRPVPCMCCSIGLPQHHRSTLPFRGAHLICSNASDH